MDDGLENKLLQDSAKGERYQRAWDDLIEPFFLEKDHELYQAFKELPTTESDSLVLLKLQVNALEALRDEFKHYINTGRLAQKQLIEELENA